MSKQSQGSKPDIEKTVGPLDLQAIRKRAEAATPGPWRTPIHSGDIYGGNLGCVHIGVCYYHPTHQDPNATFIAHARTDIPALLDYVAELESDLDATIKLRDQIAAKDAEREEALRALLKRALPFLEECQDESYGDEGWASDALIEIRSEIRDVLK